MPSVPLEALTSDDPRELGAYRLLGRLGSGGMGIAYLADGPSGWAVVKTMWPQLRADPSYRARLGRELDAMRAAAGPRVARVLDQDLASQNPWFAMEFVPGVTLARRVAESGALAGGEVRALAEGLAEAVAATAAAGVVHRDLKPANVMLGPSGPVLIDFGVADISEATQLTATGLVVGSAGWMAPEQITGGEVTSAVDVHSWGLCVLFAATGTPAFTGDNTTATIYQVLHNEPVVPATLGQPLAGLVTAALVKDPAQRLRPAALVAGLSGAAAVGTATAVQQAASTSVGAAPAYVPPPVPASSGSTGRGVLIGVIAAVAVLALVGVGVAVGRGSGGGGDAAAPAPTTAQSAPAPAVTVTRTATPEPAPLSTPKPTAAKATPKATKAAAVPGTIPQSQVTSVSSGCPNSLGVTGAELLADGDTSTGWRCDNRSSNAEGNINTAATAGESVTFTFARPYTISAIDINEGASGNAFRWCENGRLRGVSWDFNDGEGNESSSLPNRVSFPEGNLFLRFDTVSPHTTSQVTMTVDDIYPAGTTCTDNGETGRPWEYGPTAKPSEIRFIGIPA